MRVELIENYLEELLQIKSKKLTKFIYLCRMTAQIVHTFAMSKGKAAKKPLPLIMKEIFNLCIKTEQIDNNFAV